LNESSDGSDEADTSASNSKGADSKKLEEQYVPAPTDVNILKQPCSICMEPFKTIWHEKTQQPVWMDAIKVGNKYYHASCYNDLTKASASGLNNSPNAKRTGGTTRGYGYGGSARNTPDPILGKRKYEGAPA
jgi:pre-mRNA cleavage complex 2 protein Pcf11